MGRSDDADNELMSVFTSCNGRDSVQTMAACALVVNQHLFFNSVVSGARPAAVLTYHLL